MQFFLHLFSNWRCTLVEKIDPYPFLETYFERIIYLTSFIGLFLRFRREIIITKQERKIFSTRIYLTFFSQLTFINLLCFLINSSFSSFTKILAQFYLSDWILIFFFYLTSKTILIIWKCIEFHVKWTIIDCW